jgi:hypothetical protein
MKIRARGQITIGGREAGGGRARRVWRFKALLRLRLKKGRGGRLRALLRLGLLEGEGGGRLLPRQVPLRYVKFG